MLFLAGSVPCLSAISQQLISAPISASIALRPETAGRLQLSTHRPGVCAEGVHKFHLRQRTISKNGLDLFMKH